MPSTPDWRAIVRAHLPPAALAKDPEIVDELSQHLADLHAEALSQGRTADEALQIARTALPDEHRLARDLERARRSLPAIIADRWTSGALDARKPPRRVFALLLDLRRDAVLAVRTIRRSPGYTAVAILTLALGIGATSAIFAAVDTLLLRPMPFAAADRLVVPRSEKAASNIDSESVSFADYTDWKRQSDVFESVALWRPFTIDLTGAGQPERITAAQVSAEFFTVLAVAPLRGRTLQPGDHAAGAPRVTAISHGLWQRVFGGAADVVGRTVRIGDVPHEIVGVLPPRTVWPANAALFIPLRPTRLDADVLTRRDNLIFFSLARLRPDVDISRGTAALRTIAARLEHDYPESRTGWTNSLQPLREYLVSAPVRRALWLLLAAVGLVLLIGCANLANLGLVRGVGRARELGLRIALGASRWRLVRQLLVETLLIGLAGAAAGVLLAKWMIAGLAAMAPAGTPFIEDLGLDARVLAVTTALTLIAVVLSGLLPAVTAARVDPAPALKAESAGAGSSARVRLLRQTIVVTQVAGAVMLVIGAALLARSFWRIQHVEPGVDVDRVLTARLSLPGTRYETNAQAAAFFQRLTDRLAAAPGVESAGATSFVPVGGGGFGLGRVFLAEGAPEPPGGPDTGAQWNVVTPDYFRTVGIPVLRGRTFASTDRADTTLVAIVSQSFVARMFGAANPIGRRIRSWRDENKLREIVGVVGEVRYLGLAERDVMRQVYVPHTQDSWGLMNIVMRSAEARPEALESVLRAEVRALDANLAVSNVATLRAVARNSVSDEWYTTLLLSLVAAAALGLGALGIYGVISHTVSMRTRELGLRAALGGSSRHLYGLVFGQGLRLTGIGLALGLAGALAGSRALSGLLYQVTPLDPAVYVITSAAIVAVALLACLGPARRSARIDPLTALRGE